jgi:hypothetical protein
MDTWHTVKEAGETLRVDPKTIKRWIGRGWFGEHGARRLPNGEWRILTSGLEWFAQNHTSGRHGAGPRRGFFACPEAGGVQARTVGECVRKELARG